MIYTFWGINRLVLTQGPYRYHVSGRKKVRFLSFAKYPVEFFKQEWQYSLNEVQDIRWSDKHRVAANITEYNIISKLIFLRIIIPKFLKISHLFHIKNECNNVKINMFKLAFLLQLSNCSAFYIVKSLLGNIIPSLKLIGQFWQT